MVNRFFGSSADDATMLWILKQERRSGCITAPRFVYFLPFPMETSILVQMTVLRIAAIKTRVGWSGGKSSG